MPQLRTLITSADQKDVKNIVKIYFPDYKSFVSIEPGYDTELYNVNVRLDITNDKFSKDFLEQLKSMSTCIDGLGESSINIEIKCKSCQTWCRVNTGFANDHFFCLSCYDKKQKPSVYKCLSCNKEYNHNGCRVHLKAEVSDSKNKDHVCLKNLDIHKKDPYHWDCCSIKCAKVEYNKWLKKLLKHPWSKDYLKSV